MREVKKEVKVGPVRKAVALDVYVASLYHFTNMLLNIGLYNYDRYSHFAHDAKTECICKPIGQIQHSCNVRIKADAIAQSQHTRYCLTQMMMGIAEMQMQKKKKEETRRQHRFTTSINQLA